MPSRTGFGYLVDSRYRALATMNCTNRSVQTLHRWFPALILVSALTAAFLSACDKKGSREPTEPTPTLDQPRPSDPGADSDVAIQTIPVAGNVYMLIGRGGNIGVSVGPDGILIIDDQFAPLADKIRAAVTALSSGKLAYVLNTHHHGDHTGGNEIFGKEGTIIAHDNVRKNLVGASSPAAALPIITFDKTLTLHFNGEVIRAVHFPHGHTDGDSIIFFENSKVVHMGDHFFNGRFPFVDMDSGGNALAYEENVRTALEMIPADARIIPGHGALATRDDLVAFHTMLAETIAIVREQVGQGKSLADIQKKGLPARWKSWGEGFISTDKWLTTIHDSLKKPG